MAGKKTTRSSKTAHVLNLLSHPDDTPQDIPSTPPADRSPSETPELIPSPPAEPTPVSPPPQPLTASPSRHLSPPILEVARTNNEALEASIHSALEQALEEEEQTLRQGRTATPPPIQEEAPVPTLAEPAPEPVQSKAETTPEPAPVSPPDGHDQGLPPDHARLINVMELLVEEKLERYVKLFHLCSCPRCLADTQALALSRLPAKYVVLSAAACSPMLNFYRAKYDSDVTAQIIYACKQVMESSRHGDGPG